MKIHTKKAYIPSKIEWDLTNGPLSKLLELLDTQVEGSVQWVLLEISWIHISATAMAHPADPGCECIPFRNAEARIAVQ